MLERAARAAPFKCLASVQRERTHLDRSGNESATKTFWRQLPCAAYILGYKSPDQFETDRAPVLAA